MYLTFALIGLSVLLFIATEFFFPIDSKDQLATRQRHFWSIVLTIFSLVLTFSIKSFHETQQEIKNVAIVFGELSNDEIRMEFQHIFTQYHRRFDHAQPVLNAWAKEALTQLRKDMSEGYISLPSEIASSEIGKVYPSARASIIATNVGSTAFYFNDQNYINHNLNARARQVPVVRFYLYSKSKKIMLSNSQDTRDIDKSSRDGNVPDNSMTGQDIEAFRKDVKKIHDKLGSVYSVIIDVDSMNKVSKVRDLLILDNKFVAETVLTENWEPLKARATQDEGNLKEVHEYFRRLMGHMNTKDDVFRMSDEDVKRYFHRYARRPSSKDVPLADIVFQDVMSSLEVAR